MRHLRFGLKTLIAATTLIALGVVAALPFSPKLEFGAPKLSNEGVNEDGYFESAISMTLKNTGIETIWIAIGASSNPKSFLGGAVSSKHLELMKSGNENRFYFQDGDTWARLPPGDSIQLNCSTKHHEFLSSVVVLVADWRGRQKEVWSTSF